MKARCAHVSGCSQFNTNGYLYSGSVAVTPFTAYPLECWSFQGPPGPATLVNVTLDVALSDGLLEYWITFDSKGSMSLWDYTLSVPNVKLSKTARGVNTPAARQFVGFFEDSTASGRTDAVYFAAHDPAQIVKSCSASTSTGNLHCTVDAVNVAAVIVGVGI